MLVYIFSLLILKKNINYLSNNQRINSLFLLDQGVSNVLHQLIADQKD